MKVSQGVKAHHRAQLEKILRETTEFVPADIEVALEVIDDAIANPEGYQFFVAEEDDEVLGYASVGATPIAQDSYDLYWIVVGKHSYRKGVGRALMLAVENLVISENGRIIRLETAGRDPAQYFYESIGYKKTGCIRDFYWPGNDCLTYAKHL